MPLSRSAFTVLESLSAPVTADRQDCQEWRCHIDQGSHPHHQSGVPDPAQRGKSRAEPGVKEEQPKQQGRQRQRRPERAGRDANLAKGKGGAWHDGRQDIDGRQQPE
jgi:hypothetical protein